MIRACIGKLFISGTKISFFKSKPMVANTNVPPMPIKNIIWLTGISSDSAFIMLSSAANAAIDKIIRQLPTMFSLSIDLQLASVISFSIYMKKLNTFLNFSATTRQRYL